MQPRYQSDVALDGGFGRPGRGTRRSQAPECTRLCKGEMMRIRRHAAAHEARLSQHVAPVILIAQANRFSQSTDCIAAKSFLTASFFLAGSRVRRAGHPGLLRDSKGG